MKKISALIFASLIISATSAQTQAVLKTSAVTSVKETIKLPALDKSPMDMSYFPADYPILKSQNRATEPPMARVIYSRPQKDNRVIFGQLVEYNKVWRMGANEATEIEFFKDVVIGGKKLNKGRYTIYAIPTPTKWTIIFNKDTDTWGAFVYDESKDVLRTDVPVIELPVAADVFSISFSKTSKGADLLIAWDNASVKLPIEIK